MDTLDPKDTPQDGLIDPNQTDVAPKPAPEDPKTPEQETDDQKQGDKSPGKAKKNTTSTRTSAQKAADKKHAPQKQEKQIKEHIKNNLYKILISQTKARKSSFNFDFISGHPENSHYEPTITAVAAFDTYMKGHSRDFNYSKLYDQCVDMIENNDFQNLRRALGGPEDFMNKRSTRKKMNKMYREESDSEEEEGERPAKRSKVASPSKPTAKATATIPKPAPASLKQPKTKKEVDTLKEGIAKALTSLGDEIGKSLDLDRSRKKEVVRKLEDVGDEIAEAIARFVG